MNKLKEELAELEHVQWACWTSYFLDNLTEENMLRWRRQIKTPYVDLTEKEKDSDREWAERVMEILDNDINNKMEDELIKYTADKIIREIFDDTLNSIIWSKVE